jgi:hypothetical protein
LRESVMSSVDQKFVKADFRRLISGDCHRFPKEGPLNDVPAEQGVYIIYAPYKKDVVHVGRIYRGTKGLKQRLRNHLHGASSFALEYLKGQGSKLRKGYTFQCLPLKAWRRRALLEAYATGVLCPPTLGSIAAK